MDDLDRYLEGRLNEEGVSEKDFWHGYDDFKISVMLKEARLNSGLTQEEVAEKIHTTKSAISRIENHAEDIKLSTLERFAMALGKKLEIRII